MAEGESSAFFFLALECLKFLGQETIPFAAVSGRKPHAAKKQTQFIITENDDGASYHATPTPKKRKRNQVHSLANSVAKNQPGVTRH